MSSNLPIRENVSLAGFTTFNIGGEARYFVEVNTEVELLQSLEVAVTKSLNIFVLGGGSNVLIADDGFDGLVIKISLKGIEFYEPEDGTVRVIAKAGEDWDDFVESCVERNLAGIECLSGIPGLVGGTPIQNVGAYGQEVSETITRVRVYDRTDGEVRDLSNADCGFQYRKSIFNTTESDRYIVLAVEYLLKHGGAPRVAYADLKARFGGSTPTLQELRAAVCQIRASKGMLVRQGGSDARSAGSFFKNPVVSNEKYEGIVKLAVNEKLGEVPQYPVDEETVKLPAAWLIEKSGFQKGFRDGNAGLSTKHTLAVTNRGGSSAAEIIKLKALIEEEVRSKFGIDLIPEPTFIGFPSK